MGIYTEKSFTHVSGAIGFQQSAVGLAVSLWYYDFILLKVDPEKSDPERSQLLKRGTPSVDFSFSLS
jgi:hypothetical protein